MSCVLSILWHKLGSTGGPKEESYVHLRYKHSSSMHTGKFLSLGLELGKKEGLGIYGMGNSDNDGEEARPLQACHLEMS